MTSSESCGGDARIENDSPIDGAVVLITGGTGSFGSTVTRHFLQRGAAEVRILSRDEAKQDAMRRQLGDPRVRFHVGDVRDYESVMDAVRGTEFVFHAAALKQVPSCEFFPDQAVATNVTGSANVIRAAASSGTAAVVLLSSDKAVYPINAMGMTKALMEKAAQAFARKHPESATVVSCVRYGNVMCSRGSVIPLFVDQLRRGESMTVTNPQMTRFLMSLEESVQLVDYALASAEPGDLFVKKAPACTVESLAHAVARLMNVEPRIQVIGSRHGEKLFETLLSAEERVRGDDRGEFFRVPLDARSLDYGLFVDKGGPTAHGAEDYTSHNTRQLTVADVEQRLRQLPDFLELLAI